MMKKFQVKIPELETVPLDKREALLRRCLESKEYAASLRKIRVITFVASALAVLVLINAIAWTGVVRDKQWLGAVLSVCTLIFFFIMMLFTQMRLMVRLLRKLVRREVANA